MKAFEPKKIVDPRTGKERIMSPEEQMVLLQKGILIDIPAEPTLEEKDTDTHE